MKRIFLYFIASLVFILSGCETTQAPKKLGVKKINNNASGRLILSLSELERILVGTWNVVSTSTTDEHLENETKYIFKAEDRRCNKKNLFHGYFEELEGRFVLKRRGGKNNLDITFDNGFKEKFTIFFENENRLHMTYLTGEYKIRYILERVEDDIFDIM